MGTAHAARRGRLRVGHVGVKLDQAALEGRGKQLPCRGPPTAASSSSPARRASSPCCTRGEALKLAHRRRSAGCARGTRADGWRANPQLARPCECSGAARPASRPGIRSRCAAVTELLGALARARGQPRGRRTSESVLYHSQFLGSVKDAVVDRFRARYGRARRSTATIPTCASTCTSSRSRYARSRHLGRALQARLALHQGRPCWPRTWRRCATIRAGTARASRRSVLRLRHDPDRRPSSRPESRPRRRRSSASSAGPTTMRRASPRCVPRACPRARRASGRRCWSDLDPSA